MTDAQFLAQQEISHVFEIRLVRGINENEFREKLSALINDLITHDFEKLVNILYRLDVSEQKIKNLLSTFSEIDAGVIIADLIIERQLQKIKSRSQFSSPGDNIPDEESW